MSGIKLRLPDRRRNEMPGREWEHPTAGTGPGGFSRAIEAPAGSRLIWFAGAAPTDDNGKTVEGGIAEQTAASLGKLKALVEAAGGTMADILMLNVYVTDAKCVMESAETRRTFFPNPPYPASSGFAVSGLANPEWLVEID